MSLNIINLSKRFEDKIICNNFNYEFSDSGIYAIMGKSGAGKTTLLRLIAGLDTDYEGTILGDTNCAFAFQEYRLFPTLSALQNATIVYGDKPSDVQVQKARNLLKSFLFTDEDLNLFPSELSGGMKQRVSLARAILAERKLMLLDEPTKELDPEVADIILKKIKSIAKNALVIVVTHSASDAEKLNAKILNI